MGIILGGIDGENISYLVTTGATTCSLYVFFADPEIGHQMQDAMTAVEDIKEYDVPFHIRYAIDAGIRVGNWYTVTATEGTVTVTPRPDLIFRAEPRVCAFDIETTKLPLHFPNAEHDQARSLHFNPTLFDIKSEILRAGGASVLLELL